MNAGERITTKSKPPQIMLSYLRDSQTGKVIGLRTFDFKPGAVIERCGKKYVLQRDGSQRRI
jgi:hypothetical protein